MAKKELNNYRQQCNENIILKMLETLQQESFKKTNERKVKIATRKENRKRREFQTQIKNIVTEKLWTWLRKGNLKRETESL